MKNIPHQPLLFFDGVCNLCNSSIQFVIKQDKKQQFRFASLQSDAAKAILLQFNQTNLSLDSIILIYNDKIYSKSSAMLTVFKLLGSYISCAYIFIIIPKPIRDLVYNFIAKNRYNWYGKQNRCMIPSEDLKSRFL